jgi:transposase
MVTKYIGADVHVATTDMAVERNQRIIQQYHVPTTIPAIVEVLNSVASPKVFVMEEGSMAGWLSRGLRPYVDRVIVADPRRNAFIAKDGDKDDAIDAVKLAMLAAGGYVREVYHSDDEQRVEFKEWVGLYHDRRREQTRQVNKIHAVGRAHGVLVPASAQHDPGRSEWLRTIPVRLRRQLSLLFPGYDLCEQMAEKALSEVCRQSKRYEIIARWRDLPGIGPVRSATLFAYLDTPWRFSKPAKLWKYCGVGLERSSSGSDRRGRPKPPTLHLAWQVNKRLKDAVMGATISALNAHNPFAERYRRLLCDGLHPSNARHTVARRLLTVLWGMWKTNTSYRPDLV